YDPPPARPAPPEVEILSPASGTPSSEEEVPVSFRVKSAKPPSHIELVREGDQSTALRLAVEPGKLTPKSEGVYEAKLTVALVPGLNRLRVAAANDGGQ